MQGGYNGSLTKFYLDVTLLLGTTTPQQTLCQCTLQPPSFQWSHHSTLSTHPPNTHTHHLNPPITFYHHLSHPYHAENPLSHTPPSTKHLYYAENAIAYNHENQPLNVHAQKLAVVFERMFLEVVLSWDNPLPFSDSCHCCRSMESCQVRGYVGGWVGGWVGPWVGGWQALADHRLLCSEYQALTDRRLLSACCLLAVCLLSACCLLAVCLLSACYLLAICLLCSHIVSID